MRDADTAVALGSGDVPVLGTPALLAMMEQAACAAIAAALDGGQTSVGTWAEIEHLAATAPGAEVVATATVAAADGKRLEFRCEAHEGPKLVGRATHRRSIVDRERFLARG